MQLNDVINRLKGKPPVGETLIEPKCATYTYSKSLVLPSPETLRLIATAWDWRFNRTAIINYMNMVHPNVRDIVIQNPKYKGEKNG